MCDQCCTMTLLSNGIKFGMLKTLEPRWKFWGIDGQKWSCPMSMRLIHNLCFGHMTAGWIFSQSLSCFQFHWMYINILVKPSSFEWHGHTVNVCYNSWQARKKKPAAIVFIFSRVTALAQPFFQQLFIFPLDNLKQ